MHPDRVSLRLEFAPETGSFCTRRNFDRLHEDEEDSIRKQTKRFWTNNSLSVNMRMASQMREKKITSCFINWLKTTCLALVYCVVVSLCLSLSNSSFFFLRLRVQRRRAKSSKTVVGHRQSNNTLVAKSKINQSLKLIQNLTAGARGPHSRSCWSTAIN